MRKSALIGCMSHRAEDEEEEERDKGKEIEGEKEDKRTGDEMRQEEMKGEKRIG